MPLGQIIGEVLKFNAGMIYVEGGCGFDTFIRFPLVDPGVAWLELESLSEGAEIASAELWLPTLGGWPRAGNG